ncbi:MAG TPA: hypothetical protein VN493_03230 [Thermoanaerobaculia bacterium]|nr:hypothetical protein [Thermoanaerobaculia bacterium]
MDALALHNAEAGDRTRRAVPAELAALAALPLLLLMIDSDWIFSGPHRDAWVYYGYYENAIYLLRQFPEHYYASRLAVILPGFALHHLLPTLLANLALHLALYWAALLSFYFVVTRMFGSRVALLAGLALGCHPYFLREIGWNYVDGFGIAYFLVALLLVTLAAESPAWRPLLLAAGAMATALLSTNLFYGVYLPLLAGQLMVLGREHGRRVPLLAAALWAGLGAALLFVLFGFFPRALGRDFFYLGSSLPIVASVGTPNIFYSPIHTWIPDAVWLVFPALVLLGSAIVLARARQDRLLRWSQVPLLYLTLLMLFLQLALDRPILQYFYYPTLLIPVAFLAFAGQVSQMTAGLPGRRFAALAAAVALLQILPLCIPLLLALSPMSTLFPATALLAFLAGLGAVLVLVRKPAGTGAVLFVFLCLSLSQLLVRQGGSIFWEFERHDSDGRGLFMQMSQAVRAIERFDPSHNARIWYGSGEKDGFIYDAVASAFLLCPRMINLDFPKLPDARMCDGIELGPGVPVAVLSADPAAFEKADAAIRGIGLSARFLAREEITGPSRGFAITYLRTECSPASGNGCTGSASGR